MDKGQAQESVVTLNNAAETLSSIQSTLSTTASPPTTTTSSPSSTTGDPGQWTDSQQRGGHHDHGDVSLTWTGYLYAGLCQLGAGLAMALMHVLGYLCTSRVLFNHAVAGGLLYGLLHQGATAVEVVRTALVEELVTYLLWMLIPNSWATILSLWFCIYMYETVIGPKVEVSRNAKLIADQDIEEALRVGSPNLHFDVVKSDTGGPFVINTYLRFARHSKTSWNKVSDDDTGIPLSDVTSLQLGFDYDIVRSIRNAKAEVNQCFYFTLNENATVTFIAESQDARNQWVAALHSFFGTAIEDLDGTWMNKVLKEVGLPLEGDTILTLEQTAGILAAAGRNIVKPYLVEMLKGINKSAGIKHATEEKALQREQLGMFFDKAAHKKDLDEIYEKQLNRERGEGMMSVVKFHDFIREQQKEEINMDTAKRWIMASEPIVGSLNLTFAGFTTYMMSKTNNIFNDAYTQEYMDMTQPMSHYFIATSHNTYLMKDQLKGKSSCEAYINAFKKGCKCVELDTWDGSNNEPIIYHGHTLTSKILFKDVVRTIGENAFIVSDYPCILSFENHCSVEQQKVMAKHLVEILGDKMYTKPPPEEEKKLPSPKDLRGYIIVKSWKYYPEEDEAKKLRDGNIVDDVDDDFSDDEITEDILKDMEKEKQRDQEDVDLDSEKDAVSENGDAAEDNNNFKKSSVRSLFDAFQRDKGDGSTPKKKKKEMKVPKLAQEFSDLVAYCQAVHFKGFEYSKENAKHYEMSSFGEKKAMKFATDLPKAWQEYNYRQFSRIYPAGGRIDSSNYDPQPLWNAGCQLVALNYQTPDRSMQLNQGVFLDNGGCGFVLKPELLRQESAAYNPMGPFEETECTYLIVKVISGYQLPYSSEKHVRSDRSLYVQVITSGVEADYHKEKTKSVKDNGFSPLWNEALGFKVNRPEVANVQFVLREGGSMSSHMGQFSLPMRCMQRGYRRVPLLSKSSEPKCGSLFVHIETKDHVNKASE